MLILLPSPSREPILLTDPLTLCLPLLSVVLAPAPTSASFPRPRSPGSVHPFVALPFTFPQGVSHPCHGGLRKAHGNHSTKSNRNNYKAKVNHYLCKFIDHILSQEISLPEEFPLSNLFSDLQPPPHPPQSLSWVVLHGEIEVKGNQIPHFLFYYA